MVRSLSRGRFDRSPVDTSDTYYSMKKSSYTPRGTTSSRGGVELYATPPRSPLDGGGRSASRGRLSRDFSDGYHSGGGVEDHRNPMSEGRFGRTSSYQTRESRFTDDGDDMSHISMGGSSAVHARDVLSKMRGGSRGGVYSEPKQPLRSLGGRMTTLSSASPRRRLDALRHDVDIDDMDDMSYENHGGLMNTAPLSKYEVIGMKEELKKKDNESLALRRELDEMSLKHEDNISSVRSRLVATFKEDMQEMKNEWEDAFQRLKDESDATQRAMKMELNEAMAAKSDMESELNELKAEFRTQIEEEKSRSKSRMEELKLSKEEDLERLRSMYEEHLDSTKKSASNVESELKEEIHMLLEENEKVKMCYENLESEMSRYKSDLDEVNSNYQKALSDNLRWEKEATAFKEELEDVCDENDKHTRLNKKLEEELSDTKAELERMTSQHQRVQAEKARFEKEYNTAAKERDEASSGYNDLVKKLDDIQEERTLESRYTEALVKQRDNMNAIIENSQQEIDELKTMNTELSSVNKAFVDLGKEFHLANSDPAALRGELVKAEKMKNTLDKMRSERERYNATVKALKVDLKALHGGNVGVETSLQDHMRLLNEKWDSNESRLKQVDKLKSELEESIQLLEDNAKDRERMLKDHNGKLDSLERELQDSQTALVKMERDKIAMTEKLSNYEISGAKMKRINDELEAKCTKLEDRFARTEEQLNKREAQFKSLESDKRALQADVDKLRTKKNELADALDNMEDVKKGLKKKLESAYYDLEETQRELSSIRQDHEDEMHNFETELSKLSRQEEEIKSLKERLANQDQVIEEAKNEVAESFKVQLRLMEEKHEETYRRSNDYYEDKYKDEITELREKNKTLEAAMKDQKESLDQKSMVEIKRRGEFAKQKQELEILRSKERHLETHVNQLEEHISKVVSDYEAKLQSSSNQTICSTVDDESKALNRRVRELEKKLEVSSAAMKQIGKSSLMMEKENERLKNDKNELKIKLKKLVECAEKFGPK